MSCQVLTSDTVAKARPAGTLAARIRPEGMLALEARPQAGIMCREYIFPPYVPPVNAQLVAFSSLNPFVTFGGDVMTSF